MTSSTTPSPVAPSTEAASGEPATLVFRAIIRDENRNQLLHSGEVMSVEIEVKNEGPEIASGVEVLISGAPELIENLPPALPIGNIPPGDVKHVSVEGKVGTVKVSFQAELTLLLRAHTHSTLLPAAKKFLVAMRPTTAPDALTAAVDVDDVPKGSGNLRQPKAVGLAIGIGRFREDSMPRVKYAARDADIVASYWNAVAGIQPERIRRLTDAHALKRDLAETFEEWLPKQVDPTSVVYVYISGRGSIEPTTGAVSLIPFDGTATSGARHYSLRRLHDVLVKLPIQRAIIVLDLSLDQPKVQAGTAHVDPLWELGGEGSEKIMWMVGNRTAQEAHPYDPGHHGLFTYEWLRGLGGEADIDKDGTILAWELCTYAKGQVVKIAREQLGNAQEPLCIPGPGQGAMVWLQPMAKLK
ncbi:MAG TPA: hypothetical protein VNI35_08775 [Nitrospira sp.]|nr:hypothetical protein [Nitrospira sp.]